MKILSWLWGNRNWLAFGLSAIGIILNAQKLIICWPIWIFSNFVWISYSWPKKEWAYVSLWIIFGLFNIYG